MSLLAAPEKTASEKAAPEKQEGRYLFLIETSQAMDANKTALRKSIRSIIESGLNGQIKYGDTIGLWTYNDKLQTDFPMVMWRNEHVQDVESAVDFWMSKQKFVHRSDLSKALPLLQKIVKASQKLTIIWMTTGNDHLTGLPFNKAIDDLQKEFRDSFRKQHVPFVTLLAVRKNVLVDFTVNPGDVKLRLPEVMEKEAAAAQAAQPTAAPAEVAAPAPVKKPPLIIRVGPSPELVEQRSNAAIAAIKAAQANAEAPIASPQQPATNTAAVVKPETTINAPVVTNKAPTVVESPIAATPPSVQSNAVVPLSSPVVATSAPVAVVAKTNLPVAISVVAPQPTTAASAPAVTPEQAVVAPAQPKTMWIAVGSGVLALIVGLTIFFVKKSSAPRCPSFISQSMTREHLSSSASKPSSDNPAAPE
ncbi:MAG: hypothetical protein ACXWIU_08320 [Limisphaerales bacterium]